ncbi:hypothetical protein [Nesterenkonia pannonica]|nr:hypothetical protein [Nesterenkonia pannonica]
MFHLHGSSRPILNAREVLAFLDEPDSAVFWG